jgi:hypothetical protein
VSPGRAPILVSALASLALALGSCGGDDKPDRLSASAYKAKIAALGKREDTVHAEAEKAFSAKTVAEISDRMSGFADGEDRLGDDLDAIRPPADAQAAHDQLASGAHQLAGEIRAALGRLNANMSAKTALDVLDKRLSKAKGAAKIDAALAKLSKLGYAKPS